MNAIAMIEDIKKLSVSERIGLVEDIGNSIAEEPSFSSPWNRNPWAVARPRCMNPEIPTMMEMNRKTEALPLQRNEENIEMGERQLFALMKEAGEGARRKKKEVMARHYDRLRDAVSRAATPRESPLAP